MIIQGVSKRALQWYSKCYCVASVTKTFALKGVQTIHRSRCCTVVKLFLKHPALPAEVTKKKLHGLSPRANYTDRATPLVVEVIANFCG
jgi:hypothetical protein